MNNYDELKIYANRTKTKFTYNGLRWKTIYYKVPTYSVCSYRLMNPPRGFKGGSIYLTFGKIENGVQIYVSTNGRIADFEVLSDTKR